MVEDRRRGREGRERREGRKERREERGRQSTSQVSLMCDHRSTSPSSTVRLGLTWL